VAQSGDDSLNSPGVNLATRTLFNWKTPVSTSPPLHRILLLPPGGELESSDEALLAALGGQERPLTLDALPEGLPQGGGWLVVPARASEVVEPALSALVRSPDPWALLMALPDGGPGAGSEAGSQSRLQFVSCSPGFPESAEEIARRMDAAGLDRGTLSHRQVLLDLSRIRHDVNNALTSALAEAQFMRMDAEAGTELADGLELVERQLQKIRDLIAELSALRVTGR